MKKINTINGLIVELVEIGESLKDIASETGISLKTIKRYFNNNLSEANKENFSKVIWFYCKVKQTNNVKGDTSERIYHDRPKGSTSTECQKKENNFSGMAENYNGISRSITCY